MPFGRRLRIDPLVFLMLLLVEFLIFDQIGAKHYTKIFPRWNDQIQYLGEAYAGYEYLHAHGFWSGIWQTLTNQSAQGTLHDFWAVLVFCVAGPSRSAALAVNMLAFIAWQAALFFAVRRAFASPPLAWISAGLLLALASPWTGIQGSTTDFRLDWLAASTMGITLAAAMLTEGFRRTNWSVLFGLAVGITLLTRFLTGTYFVVIFAALLAWTLAGQERKLRTANLLIAALAAAIVAGPAMWINRTSIYNYYYIGHFIGPESAIRNQNMGLTHSITWVCEQLYSIHLGQAWMWLFAIIVATMATAGWISVAKTTTKPATSFKHSAFVLGSVFLLAPALVLVLHQQKSFVVLSIMLPGIMLLAVAIYSRFIAHIAPPILMGTAAISIAIGGLFFLQRMRTNPHTADFIAGACKVNELADQILDRSQAMGQHTPTIGIDRITDCLDGQVLRIICYERKKAWVPFRMSLPMSIAEAPETEIMDRLARSDFMFLTEKDANDGYPYDRQMRALLPKTQAWCAEHMRLINRFQIFGQHLALYQRYSVPSQP